MSKPLIEINDRKLFTSLQASCGKTWMRANVAPSSELTAYILASNALLMTCTTDRKISLIFLSKILKKDALKRYPKL
jgi:hypothetical protein